MERISKLGKILERIINIVYPNTCMVCGKDLKSGEALCKKCQNEFEYIREPICKKCGKKLYDEEKEYCMDCKKHIHQFDSGIAVFSYNEAIKKCIYEFKYKDMKIYGRFFGRKMAEYGREYFGVWKAEVIIPVPVSKKKFLKRGYNQAEILAKELAKNTGIPMDNHVLYRSKDTKPQKEVNRDTRRKNLENAFIVSKNVVKYKKVILVDDIYTTGSTIDECAKTLKAAGVQKVYFISQSIGQGA